MEAMKLSGMKDDRKYLVKELDSWDVWNLDESTRSADIRRLCSDWLDK